jgi:hypothetical protein
MLPYTNAWRRRIINVGRVLVLIPPCQLAHQVDLLEGERGPLIIAGVIPVVQQKGLAENTLNHQAGGIHFKKRSLPKSVEGEPGEEFSTHQAGGIESTKAG